jgi:hypothetical protein
VGTQRTPNARSNAAPDGIASSASRLGPISTWNVDSPGSAPKSASSMVNSGGWWAYGVGAYGIQSAARCEPISPRSCRLRMCNAIRPATRPIWLSPSGAINWGTQLSSTAAVMA